MSPPRRIVLLALAAMCAAGAWFARDGETVPLSGWLAGWERAHPDPRAFAEEELDRFRALVDDGRRDDLVLLLIGLAAGCAVAGLSARAVGAAGGPLRAVLLGGAVAVGSVGLATSVRDQWSAAGDGAWTLGDDALSGLAGVHADTLRGWRERIAQDDTVILVGTDSLLSSVTAWALYPRAIYPLVRRVPPGTDGAELRDAVRRMQLGPEHGARWVVDLEALAEGGLADRPALQELEP